MARISAGSMVIESSGAGWKLSSLTDAGNERVECYPSGLAAALSLAGLDDEAGRVSAAEASVRSAAAGRSVPGLKVGRVRMERRIPSTDQVPTHYVVEVQSDDVVMTDAMLAAAEAFGHPSSASPGDVLPGKWVTRRYPASLAGAAAFAVEESVRVGLGDVPPADAVAEYEALAALAAGDIGAWAA